jgi:hypothetical protein
MFVRKTAKEQTKETTGSTNGPALRRLTFMEHGLGHDSVEHAALLQSTIGNQATLRLLAQRTAPPRPVTIQPELVVGKINDPLEHEAARVADQVMREPAPELSIRTIAPRLSHKCSASEKEKKAQKLSAIPARSAGPAVDEAFPIVHQVLSSDQPQAYTPGQDIVCSRGEHEPYTSRGQHLIEHELTHVLQRAAAGPRIMRQAGSSTGPAPPFVTPPAPVGSLPAPGGPFGKWEPAPGPWLSAVEQQKLNQDIEERLKKTNADEYMDAVKKILEAFLGTPKGKKLKDLVIASGWPIFLISLSNVAAAMISKNTDIPSTPDIDLAEGYSVNIGFEGSWQQPKSVTFALKYKWGAAPKERAVVKKPPIVDLPPNIRAFVDRIDRDTLRKWAVERAFHEYDVAGPNEEEDKKKFYQKVRDDQDMLPDADLMAEGLAVELLAQGLYNRSYDFSLNGKDGEKDPLKNFWNELWDRFPDRFAGLFERLKWLVDLLIPKLLPPPELRMRTPIIEQVSFIAGDHYIPVRVSEK